MRVEPVHEREQLEDDVAHHLSMGFVRFGHEVYLVDENDGGHILLGLKCLHHVTLIFPSHDMVSRPLT